MRSRNKVILVIIGVWILLISFILYLSQSLFTSGFTKLENDLATDNAQRAYHVSLSILNYLYLQNVDTAYWDKTYEYMEGKNPTFITDNFSPDYFFDNKINDIIILDKVGNVKWSNAFDLVSRNNQQIDAEIINYFKQNGAAILAKNPKFFEVTQRPYGASGFLELKNQSVMYFALNDIKDTKDTLPSKGIMIFGKTLNDEYLKKLSSDLSYPITFLPLKDLESKPEYKEILSQLFTGDAIYTAPQNEKIFLSYILLRDFNKKPIGVLRIEQSRNIYNESINSTRKSQIILFVFSMFGMIAMSVLVYLFFRKQDLITRSFERFVPHQLLDLLKKRDILDIGLGDNAKKNMSVLFMDIRNFTTISERFNSQENFDFINTLLKNIAPIISEHNGFIDKYIGDAIMALFPKAESSADDAVQAAKHILKEVDKLNHENKLKTQSPVKVGVGINTGEVMLGIIGAEGRLEGTVISDMVNTASRIETLTKTYGHEILISKQCYDAMKNPKLYNIQYIDDVLVKGKTKKIAIYSVENL